MNAKPPRKTTKLPRQNETAKYIVREIGSRVCLFEGDDLNQAQNKRDTMRDSGKVMATIFELRNGVRREVVPDDPHEAAIRKILRSIRQTDAVEASYKKARAKYPGMGKIPFMEYKSESD